MSDQKNNTDIYLQNEPCVTPANDNLKSFVKFTMLIAKTVSGEEQLEILQNFVRGKIRSFQEMELMSKEQELRELEKKEK